MAKITVKITEDGKTEDKEVELHPDWARILNVEDAKKIKADQLAGKANDK